MPSAAVQKGDIFVPLRRQRSVLVIQGSSRAPARRRPEVKADDAIQEPYGLCWDTGRGGLWLSDKLASRIRFYRDGNLTEETFSLTTEFLNEPCGLDYHAHNGLLVGCYGACSSSLMPGGVYSLDSSGSWKTRTPKGFNSRVTKCVWLPNNCFAYVTTDDCVLRICSADNSVIAATSPARYEIPSPSGSLKDLHFRCVQSLLYSKTLGRLLVGDSSFGSIFSINLEDLTYSILLGRPRFSSVGELPELVAGIPQKDAWLGSIVSMFEIGSDIYWINGDLGLCFGLDQRGRVSQVSSFKQFIGDDIVPPVTVAIAQ